MADGWVVKRCRSAEVKGEEIEEREERLDKGTKREAMGESKKRIEPELRIMRRLLRRNRNQHRRTKHYRYLTEVSRNLGNLDLDATEELISRCRSSSGSQGLTLKDFNLLGSPIHKVIQCIRKASLLMLNLLADNFFMAFALTFFSMLAEIHAIIMPVYKDLSNCLYTSGIPIPHAQAPWLLERQLIMMDDGENTIGNAACRPDVYENEETCLAADEETSEDDNVKATHDTIPDGDQGKIDGDKQSSDTKPSKIPTNLDFIPLDSAQNPNLQEVKKKASAHGEFSQPKVSVDVDAFLDDDSSEDDTKEQPHNFKPNLNPPSQPAQNPPLLPNTNPNTTPEVPRISDPLFTPPDSKSPSEARGLSEKRGSEARKRRDSTSEKSPSEAGVLSDKKSGSEARKRGCAGVRGEKRKRKKRLKGVEVKKGKVTRNKAGKRENASKKLKRKRTARTADARDGITKTKTSKMKKKKRKKTADHEIDDIFGVFG